MQMLKDIGHPYAKGQEGLRRHLRERAGGRAHQPPVPPGQPPRRHGGRHRRPLRAGARLGTYGVGDHMSHYNVNASVPKTLIQYLIGWVAESERVQRRREARAEAGAGDRDQPRAGARRARRARPPSAPTSCRTSTSTTSCASATRRPRSRSSPGTPGAASTSCARSASGWACSCERFFRQPVQAQRRAERAQGGLGRLAFAARRLARAVRRQRQRVAQGPGASACERVKVFKS